jgi:hypothetical protein
LDEVDYSAPVDEKDESTIRVPWEILVSLYERLPTSDERVGDFALLALRVKELFEAAKTWQDEISVYTMLSNRGGKRRAAQEVSEEDAERSQQMEMDRMKQLAKSPILSKVSSATMFETVLSIYDKIMDILNILSIDDNLF